MSEKLKLYIALLITNTICVLAFIGLAIYFDKWWIALFSALFLSSAKKSEGE